MRWWLTGVCWDVARWIHDLGCRIDHARYRAPSGPQPKLVDVCRSSPEMRARLGSVLTMTNDVLGKPG